MTSAAPKPIDRTARVLASVAVNSSFAIFTTLLGFWATPVVLHAIGTERFGLSRALVDVFANLALLEFGLAGASRSLLAVEHANAQPERKALALAMTLRAYWRATGRKLVAAAALVWAIPFVIHIEHISRTELRIGGAIIGVVSLSTPVGGLLALLSAEQREYAASSTIGVQNILVTVSAVVFALLHWGIPGQMLSQVFGALFLVAMLMLLTRSTRSAARAVNPSQDRAANAAFSSLNRATFWRMLAGRIALMSDRVIIAIILGGNAVTGFHATLRLTDSVFPHLASIGNSAWPAMVDIHNKGDQKLFARRLAEVTTTICGVGVMLVIPVLSFNRSFVDLWLGPGIFGGWFLTIVASINVIFLSLISYWEWLFQCTQKVNAILPVTGVACVVNLSASVICTYLLGPVGPAFGTFLATSIVVIPWEVTLLRRHFGLSAVTLWMALGKPFLLSAPYIVLCHWLAAKWLPTRWDALAAFAALSAGGWGLIAWWTIFDADTRQLWTKRIRRLLPAH